jgi:predicted dehydrogenase
MAFKLGVAGLIHQHVWGLIDTWAAVDDVELTAVADSTRLLDKARDRFQTAYTDWQEMLDKEQLDALIVTSNNVESAEITVQALGKGIPCMVEKAMAASAADADRMLAAQKSSGKLLMINWPVAWWPVLHQMKGEIDKGGIGPVFHFRIRLGHWGPKEIGCDPEFVEWLYDEKLNGGGAIADFCGYGAVLCRALFGMPESVYCVRDNYTKDYEISDDYAICILKYPKMNAMCEGTWATWGLDNSPSPLVYGKTGTLAVYEEKRLVRHTPGQMEEIEVIPLEVATPAKYFLECLRTGKEPEGILNANNSADACRIIDAAKRSAASGCEEKL